MTTHMTVTREEWLAARMELLAAEKELTRKSDELARRRQSLPWVRVDKAYRFETDAGSAVLEDLFQGRSQLLVYHFMFGPDYKAGCASCSAIADGFNGVAVHLANHDVMLWAVSRAPLPKLQAFKERMGWSFPWASADGDGEYNYRRGGGRPMPTATLPDAVVQSAAMSGAAPIAYVRERPGMSAFVLEDGVVYHTYSAYARGLDALWGMYPWLDRAPKGRNETGVWWRHHDMYDKR